jgi:hypothetical protein
LSVTGKGGGKKTGRERRKRKLGLRLRGIKAQVEAFFAIRRAVFVREISRLNVLI